MREPLAPSVDNNFQLLVEEAKNRLAEDLRKAFQQTIEEARKRKLNWNSPIGGKSERNFCKGHGHSIPARVFSAISDRIARRILPHYASLWFDDSLAHVQMAYQRLVTLASARPGEINPMDAEFTADQWAYRVMIQQVRDFFRLKGTGRLPKFYPWTSRELRS